MIYSSVHMKLQCILKCCVLASATLCSEVNPLACLGKRDRKDGWRCWENREESQKVQATTSASLWPSAPEKSFAGDWNCKLLALGPVALNETRSFSLYGPMDTFPVFPYVTENETHTHVHAHTQSHIYTTWFYAQMSMNNASYNQGKLWLVLWFSMLIHHLECMLTVSRYPCQLSLQVCAIVCLGTQQVMAQILDSLPPG